MQYLYLWLYPILAAALVFGFKRKSLNRILLLGHSILHLGMAVALFLPESGIPALFGTDSLAHSFVLVSALLYLTAVIYGGSGSDRLSAKQSSIYCICMIAFVAAMDSANLSQNLGSIWVFVETTTLASAMLISFEHHKQSLEAAWKYLFICSIGIALAFVGILLLLIAFDHNPSLLFPQLKVAAAGLNPFWLKISFVFMLIGFGTKVGLAPLHFWLPDAHSEAPAAVSALLSGALLNTALLPLIRMQEVMNRAALGYLATQLFLALGIASLFVAAVFILKVKNFKRLLAYSSIENMGLILIAFALGSYAGKAGLIHTLGHSLIKAAFFLSAGNLISIFAAKDYDKCSALLSRHPQTGWLWLLCFAFIMGLPPSPLFFSEFYLVLGFITSGGYLLAIVIFALLAVIAFGLGRATLTICLGETDKRSKLPLRQYLPQIVLLLAAIAVPIALKLM